MSMGAMVEFYDPDTTPQPPPWASASAEVDPPRSTMPRPVPEFVILGLGVILVVWLLWATTSGLRDVFNVGFALMQIAYPLGTAMVVAAVTSLLLRRVLRAHREIQAEESAALRDDLEALAARIDERRA